MALSFPYPVVGAVTRPRGQGCTSCVHSRYCPALYYYQRYVDYQPKQENGRACTSWSTNPADQIRTWTADDLAQNERTYIEGVQTEANRCGIVDAVTGNDRDKSYP